MSLDTAAASGRGLLLELSWVPDGTTRVYRRYASDVETIEAATGEPGGPFEFAPVPTLGVEFPMISGSIQAPVATMTSTEIEPFNLIRLGEPLPRDLRATFWRFDPDDVDASMDVLFEGTIVDVRPNAKRKKGVFETRIKGKSGAFETTLGFPADSFCVLRFGDATCGLDLPPLIVPVTIAAISGFVVEVDGIGDPENESERWIRGRLEIVHDEGAGVIGGGRLVVRGYDEGTRSFLVNRRLPATMIGRELRAVPGCKKTLTSCRYWAGAQAVNTERNFAGYGMAIPARNPTIEAD